MRVFNGFGSLPQFVNPVVTVGSYDGVHIGHRELLGRITEIARSTGGESVVITFSPHPRAVLGNRGEKVELLNTLGEKELLLRSVGIDNLIIAPFTAEFSRVSPYDFVHSYLVGKVGVKTLVVGFNHHFGHNHQGDFHYLEKLRDEFGFSIYEIPEQDVKHHKVSSTVIRNLIRTGDMKKAAEFLGFPYFIIAAGFPAPLPEEFSKLLPAPGMYQVGIHPAGILPHSGNLICNAMLEIDGKGNMAFQNPDTVKGTSIPGQFIIKFC